MIKEFNQFANEGLRDKMTPKSDDQIKHAIKKLSEKQKNDLLRHYTYELNFDMIKFLIENGADPKYADDSISILQRHKMRKNKEIRELIATAKEKRKPINRIKDFFGFNEAVDYTFKNDQQKQRYEKYLDQVNNAKVGDILDNDVIYQYIEYLTIQAGKYEYSFVDGDLSERIEEYGEYVLKELLLDALDLDEWDVDKDTANEYRLQYLKGKEYPPIVVDAEYSIIDGIHRANGLKKAGLTKILAFVGIKR